MIHSFVGLFIGFLAIPAFAANDFCVSGVKGTLVSGYVIKITHSTNSERTLTLFDSSKNVLFSTKAENRFTQFNSSGYGVCSIAGSGADSNFLQYKLELKVGPHFKAECNQVDIPLSSEYLTLKIIPKGTTLGDDLTAYALSIVPCP